MGLPADFGVRDSDLTEIVIPNNAHETFVYEQDGCAIVYEYWYDVNVPVSGGVRTWFGAQGGDHPFPPQWGRISTLEVVGCESMFKSAFFSCPDWTPLSEVPGIYSFLDFSQEFVCGAPTLVGT